MPGTQSSPAAPPDFARQYMEKLGRLMLHLDFTVIAKIIETFEKARRAQRKIYFIGNGGSAATASHFANDLACVPVAPGEPAFKSISLAANISAITALANDTGYENVFLAQIKNLLEPGDVLVSISASGNSPNIVKAVEYAKERQATNIGLSGFDGGKLKAMCDLCLHVETPKGEYGPVEDVHMSIDHLTTNYLRALHAR